MSVRYGPVRFYGFGALVLWAVGRLLLLLLVTVGHAVTHPRTSAAVAVAAVVVWAVLEHPTAVALVLLALAVALEAWSLAGAASFRRHAALRALAWARSVLLYRRLWSRAMRAAGLVVDDEHVPPRWRVPRLAGVRCTPTHDLVRVRGLLGQTLGAWDAAAPVLARAFGAVDVLVVRGDDRRLTLELERGQRGRSWSR